MRVISLFVCLVALFAIGIQAYGDPTPVLTGSAPELSDNAVQCLKELRYYTFGLTIYTPAMGLTTHKSNMKLARENIQLEYVVEPTSTMSLNTFARSMYTSMQVSGNIWIKINPSIKGSGWATETKFNRIFIKDMFEKADNLGDLRIAGFITTPEDWNTVFGADFTAKNIVDESSPAYTYTSRLRNRKMSMGSSPCGLRVDYMG